MTEATAISHRTALRLGNGWLIAAFVGSVGVVSVVAYEAPALAILLPVAILAACVGAFLFSQPRLNFIVWLGGLALLFSSESGLQIHEVLYGLYFYAYLAHWYGRRLLLYKRPIIRGAVDLSIALWLVLGLGLGIGLGLIFGADPLQMRGEAIALTMLAIYFPIKDFCRSDKYGPEIILVIIAWIGVWITIDNLLIAQRTFSAATQLWEISDVRTSGRELLLTFAGILILSILPTLRRRPIQIATVGLIAVLLGGLLLTKSRTFWVEYLLALAVLLLLANGRERRLLLAWCLAGAGLLVAAVLAFAKEYFQILFVGVSSRFATLGTADADLSLLNRFVETDAVLSRVLQNPILGYGLGSDFSFFDIISLGTNITSYSHNGFLAVAFKFGLWGSLLVAFVWLASISRLLKGSRTFSKTIMDRAIIRGSAACALSFVLPALTSSVFFEDEKIAALMLVLALGLGLLERTGIDVAGARLGKVS